MKFIIYILLIISGPSIIIGDPELQPLTSADLNEFIETQRPIHIIAGTNSHSLKLLKNGKLGENKNVIVWKASFEGINVAVKIVWDEETYDDEVSIYERLGAMTDPTIENKGIPKVYYHGQIFTDYFCIIMTLFDGTLKDRFDYQNKHFDNITILLMFKRLVEILKYIHSKNVIHNDLKPQNIFLRGSEVFIGDFDVSTLDGKQSIYGSAFYASKNMYNGTNRFEMDDIESLVYTMWYLSKMPMSPCEGRVLLLTWGKNAEKRMFEKCKHYTDKDVRSPIQYVCTEEIVSDRKIPNYDKIIEKFNVAIEKVMNKTGKSGFEWLKHGSSSTSTGSNDAATPLLMEKQVTSTNPMLSTRYQPPLSNRPPIARQTSLGKRLVKKILQNKLDLELGMMRGKEKFIKIIK